MKIAIVCLTFCLLFLSCAPKLDYAITAPLTKESFEGRTQVYRGTIPTGWFTSRDTAIALSVDSWLMSDELSAIIVFRELHLHQQSDALIRDNGLEYLAEMSYQFSKTDSTILTVEPHEYTLKDNAFCSYEILSGSTEKRFVVFLTKEHAFECESYLLNGIHDATNLKNLYTIQQTVLASLQFPASPIP